MKKEDLPSRGRPSESGFGDGRPLQRQALHRSREVGRLLSRRLMVLFAELLRLPRHLRFLNKSPSFSSPLSGVTQDDREPTAEAGETPQR